MQEGRKKECIEEKLKDKEIRDEDVAGEAHSIPPRLAGSEAGLQPQNTFRKTIGMLVDSCRSG